MLPSWTEVVGLDFVLCFKFILCVWYLYNLRFDHVIIGVVVELGVMRVQLGAILSRKFFTVSLLAGCLEVEIKGIIIVNGLDLGAYVAGQSVVDCETYRNQCLMDHV